MITEEDLKSTKSKFKNLLFVGKTGIGKSNAINDWFNKRVEYRPYFLTPSCMHLNENGILVKTKDVNKKLVYDCVDNNVAEEINNPNTIAIIDHINYYTSEQIKVFEPIIINRKCVNNTVELDNLKLVIATAYPETKNYNITNIDNFKEYFDIYDVCN